MDSAAKHEIMSAIGATFFQRREVGIGCNDCKESSITTIIRANGANLTLVALETHTLATLPHIFSKAMHCIGNLTASSTRRSQKILHEPARLARADAGEFFEQ